MILIMLLGFLQNWSYTFTSRARNSGSLAYHSVAVVFSNGVYCCLLFLSIDMLSKAKEHPAIFIGGYVLSTVLGSVSAHMLALRMERGKGARRS